MIESLSALHFYSCLLEWISHCPQCWCVSVLYAEARVGLLTPLSYSGSFLVILLVGGQYWLLMMTLGEGCGGIWKWTAPSNALLWFNLQQPPYFCPFQIGSWVLSLNWSFAVCIYAQLMSCIYFFRRWYALMMSGVGETPSDPGRAEPRKRKDCSSELLGPRWDFFWNQG